MNLTHRQYDARPQVGRVRRHFAGRRGPAGLREHRRSLGPDRRRTAQVVRHRLAFHLFQMAARARAPPAARHARTAVLPAGHLQVAADPAARSAAPRTNGCASRTRRRPSAAGRRSSACCPARSRTCTSCGNTSTPSAADSRRTSQEPGMVERQLHRAAGEVRAVPSHRREPAADDSPVRARRRSGRLGRAVRARINDESAHPQRNWASCAWCPWPTA